MARYVALWFPMIAIAVANGALREAWLSPALGEDAGRQASTVLLLALLTVYFRFVFRTWRLASSAQASAVGIVWLGLTLAFEFALGRFVSRLSWEAMFAEYDLAAGKLWALVPLWVAAAPLVFHRLEKARRGP